MRTFGLSSILAAVLSVSVSSSGVGYAASTATPAQDQKPNIILIVADDLGYGELGCQGFAKDIPTPNIDALAANGARCTSGYVSCPVCSPTRAGLLSGRYQQRFGHEFNPGAVTDPATKVGLPLDQITLANRLKDAGYATGMVGKWHLGSDPEYRPLKRGFDEFYGFLGGAHAYKPQDNAAKKANANPNNQIMRGDSPIEAPEYLTDAFGDESVKFIEAHAGAEKPFFLYLTFNAVHNPLQATDARLKTLESITDPKRRTFAAMLASLDDNVGKVTEALKAKGIDDKTLVMFISDNGGPTAQTTSKNGPLRGFKGQVLEGGIRVPYIVQWKGVVPPGLTYDKPVISFDLHATALAAAKAENPSEGVDLVPAFKNRSDKSPHDKLFWRFGEQRAIRKGDWKLVQLAGGEKELYNLADDPGESKNLIGEKAELAKELEADWKTWNSELAEPRWEKKAANKKAANAKKKAANKKKKAAKANATDQD